MPVGQNGQAAPAAAPDESKPEISSIRLDSEQVIQIFNKIVDTLPEAAKDSTQQLVKKLTEDTRAVALTSNDEPIPSVVFDETKTMPDLKKVKLQYLPTFHGRKDENAKAWLQKMKSAASDAELSPKAIKELLLKKSDEDAFNAITAWVEDQYTLKDIVNAFESSYIPERLTPALARQRICTLQKDPSESIASFALRLGELASACVADVRDPAIRLSKKEELMLNNFERSLPADIMIGLQQKRQQRRSEGRKPFTFRELNLEALALERSNLERLHFLSQQTKMNAVQPRQSSGVNYVSYDRSKPPTGPAINPNQMSVPFRTSSNTGRRQDEFLLTTPEGFQPGYLNYGFKPMRSYQNPEAKQEYQAQDRKLPTGQAYGQQRPLKKRVYLVEEDPSENTVTEEDTEEVEDPATEFLTQLVAFVRGPDKPSAIQQRPDGTKQPQNMLGDYMTRLQQTGSQTTPDQARLLVSLASADGPPVPLNRVGGDQLPTWMLPILAKVSLGTCIKCGQPGHRMVNSQCPLRDKVLMNKPCTACGRGLHSAENCMETFIKINETEAKQKNS